MYHKNKVVYFTLKYKLSFRNKTTTQDKFKSYSANHRERYYLIMETYLANGQNLQKKCVPQIYYYTIGMQHFNKYRILYYIIYNISLVLIFEVWERAFILLIYYSQ